MMATNSPCSTVQADVVEGRDLHVTHLVDPADPPERDDRGGHRSVPVLRSELAAAGERAAPADDDATARERAAPAVAVPRSLAVPVTTTVPSASPEVISASVFVTSPTSTAVETGRAIGTTIITL